MDDKQSKFLDTAEKRTAEVIRKIRTLKRCANTNTYDYTPQQVNQMFDAIDEAPPRRRSWTVHFRFTEILR